MREETDSPSRRPSAVSAQSAQSPGRSRGGPARIGIKDVAQEAGVSRSTVSNVLLRPEIVSEELRSRVQQAIDGLGYVPSAAARSLRHGRVHSLGAVFFDLANPFFARLVQSMHAVTTRHGYTLSVMSTNQDPSLEAASLDLLHQHGVRATALTSAMTDLSVVRHAKERGMAVLLIAQRSEEPGVGWIGVDDRAAMQALAAHVLTTGRRRIGFIDGPGGALQHQARGAGLRAALEAAGIDAARELITVVAESPDISGGRQAASKILAEHPEVEALMCINDYTAMGALAAASAARRCIPDDLAVTGFDDVEMASLLATPLTTVRQPLEAIGLKAAELLIEANEAGQTTFDCTEMRWELMLRESTGVTSTATR